MQSKDQRRSKGSMLLPGSVGLSGIRTRIVLWLTFLLEVNPAYLLQTVLWGKASTNRVYFCVVMRDMFFISP